MIQVLTRSGAIALGLQKDARNMKSVLCVVDLGESTSDVLDVAASIASSTGSHVFILFAYRLINMDDSADVMLVKQAMENDAVRKFQVWEEKSLKQNDLSYEFNAEIGFTGDRIHSYIRRNLVSSVVIGERQAASCDEGRGLTLREFVSQKQIPVFIVPENGQSDIAPFKVERVPAIKL